MSADAFSEYPPIPVEFLLERGSCCGSWCQNCPYVNEHGERFEPGEEHFDQKWLQFLNEHPHGTWAEYQAQFPPTE